MNFLKEVESIMGKKTDTFDDKSIHDIKQLDQAYQQLMKSYGNETSGRNRNIEISDIYSKFNEMVRYDTYNFMQSKNITQNTYSYLTDAILGKQVSSERVTGNKKTPLDIKKDQAISRLNLEQLFNGNGGCQAASIFMNQASDMMHICDEVESVCAYMYQLEEAIEVLRDNVMNSEQVLADLPFDIKFSNTSNIEHNQEYIKVIEDVIKKSGMIQKLNDHVVPKTIKFGRYYVMTLPYSEIGIKMLQNAVDHTRGLFGFCGTGFNQVQESTIMEDNSYIVCMENIDKLLDSIYTEDSISTGTFGSKDEYRSIIEEKLKLIQVDESDTPPNITGISESTFLGMDPEMKSIVDNALKKSGNTVNNYRYTGSNDKGTDGTINIETIENIPGTYDRLVDPRQLVPIKIFDHVIGYYYFDGYDHTKNITTITDILSNTMNFNEQNMIMDNIVGAILQKLKYGDVLKGDNNFKSLILNCIMYAERRNNPIKIKFVPVEYITEFKTNCDQDGNGQPVLLRSIIYGRLYISLLLFTLTAIFTKSTDTEFYYLKDGLLTDSFAEQAADIIEQFRNSNIDISQILNGAIMGGNRAINKRYFMSTGTQDEKPFTIDVVSGQDINTHTDILNDLKKMAIGSTGVPSVAVDYMDEIEFATILKMTNTKTMNRSNKIQIDMNLGITEWVRKEVRYNRPGTIPDDILDAMECTLRKSNKINNDISSDEINNVSATVDSMIETFYKGQETETPPELNFEKEEMRKQLIMLLTPSLPWGYMDKIKNEVKINAKIEKYRNDISNAGSNMGYE